MNTTQEGTMTGTTTGLLIAVDGTVHRQPVGDGAERLGSLQGIVNGMIDILTLADTGVCLVINDDGKATEEVNVLASSLFADFLFPGDYLCGPVLMMADAPEGELASFPHGTPLEAIFA